MYKTGGKKLSWQKRQNEERILTIMKGEVASVVVVVLLVVTVAAALERRYLYMDGRKRSIV
jgi:hypothetical protein